MNLIEAYMLKREEFAQLQRRMQIVFNCSLRAYIEDGSVVFETDVNSFTFPPDKIAALRDWLINITKERDEDEI